LGSAGLRSACALLALLESWELLREEDSGCGRSRVGRRVSLIFALFFGL
jgi:hypothetical protein